MFVPGDDVLIELMADVSPPVRSPRICIGVNNSRGDRVRCRNYLSPADRRVEGRANVQVTFRTPLYPGRYVLDVIRGRTSVRSSIKWSAAAFEVLQDGYLGSSHPYFPEVSVLVPSVWRPSAKISGNGNEHFS